jgi:hypothetical protein
MLLLVTKIPNSPFQNTLKAFGLTNSKGQILRPFRSSDFVYVPKRDENDLA